MPGIHPGFIQEGPELKNPYEADELLRTYLRFHLPLPVLAKVESDLKRFAERCVTDIFALGERAEAQPPKHVPYSPWGQRIDEIEVSNEWKLLHDVSAEEGLIAIGFEREHGEHSRLHQLAKLFLFHPSSAFMTCPLAMTDGAARVIELHGPSELKAKAFRHLTSRDPKEFWTSGQWMTERTGGSDVSSTSTVARPAEKSDAKGTYLLSGDKWFTSATTAQMSMALAKVEGANDSKEGLSLFYVELRDESGRLKKIRINRLKDKLGTKALPTAELTLEGTPGVLIGDVGEGVRKVSSLLNITRLYNSVTAVGTIARAVQLSKDYALKRSAFGRKLAEQPLHLQTLAGMQAEYEGVFHFVFHLIHLLGKDETGKARPEESALLRLLTPVVKLWSAKQALALVSEAIECFGGAGYIEDTGLPRLLRDAQVFSIWEGTTNVLSLDVLRAIAKENALEPFSRDVSARLAKLKSPSLASEIAKAKAGAGELQKYAMASAKASADEQQAGARAFAFGLARLYAGSLLLEFAESCETRNERPASIEVARRFFAQPLAVLPAPEDLDLARLKRLVYG